MDEYLTGIQNSVKLPKLPKKEQFAEAQHIFDNRMIRRAITLSQFALTEPEAYRPFGALVVRDNDRKLLSECVSNIGKSKDPSAHGILLAIRDACKLIGNPSLEDCTLYSSCEPCAMCAALIHNSKLSRMVYACSLDDVTEYADVSAQFDDVKKPVHERSTPAVNLSSKEALEVIKAYFASEGDNNN